MAAKGTIGGKIVLEGEKAYRDALKNIKADQQELRSEMKLCQSEFASSQNTLEALTKKHEILSKQLGTQTGKVELYQKAIEMSTQKQEHAAGKINELQRALKEAEQEMERLSAGAGDNSEAIEEQFKAIEELKNKLVLAEEGYGKAGQKTKYYQTALNTASAELHEIQGNLDQTAKYMKEAEQSTDHCATSIDEYGRETQNAAEKTSVFGDVLKANLASEVILAGLKKLADGIRQVAEASVEVGAEFEASMSQVAATMGMTAEEINAGSEEYGRLAEAAKQCGKTTKYSASESAEALNYLALAGYDVEKSVEILPKVLNLAAAGGLDLAYASDLVTDSMAALGMETKELDKYIDEMARTSQKSNTSVAQLGEATLVCAGTVTLTGQKLETMNAELGVLANNGIKGAEGGTHLRNVLLSLSAPTESAEIAIHQMGLAINDSNGNMRDLNDIMTDLNIAMEGMSSTERTQMISRIFNKTDIAAVNALLKGTGGEFQNLARELQGCAGAAVDMANTMNNNLKGKVTVLKSSLEALGISAYEIFDKDMKKAVEGATGAVGRLQHSIERGELGVSLNKMSKALGEFCENAIDVGEDALPVLIDGFTWILDHTDLIIAGIAGIAAANLEMKVVGPAINAVQAAWEAYKTANEGATVSQWLLNTAMSANPAGLLVTAIAGLTAAVAAYLLINKDNLVVLDETTKATRDMIEQTRAMNDEYAGSKETREQTRAGLEQEATAAKKLVDELASLQAKTKLTAAEEARQKQIIQELNQAYPELNLYIDEQSGLLNMTTDAIYENIDALSALDKANAARADMEDIAKRQWEAEKQLLDLQEQLAKQAEVLAEKQKRLETISAQKGGANYSTALTAARTAAKTAQQDYDDLQQSITDTEASIKSMKEEYQYCYNYISENEYKAEEATDRLGDAARRAGDDISGMSDAITEAFQEMHDSVKETVESQINLFSEFRGEVDLTGKEILENMQSQVEGIRNWADNMEILADRGINQGLLQHLADMGPEGAGYVAAFVEMTDEELAKANELFEETFDLSSETADKVMGAYETAGKNAAGAFGEGIAGSAEEVNAETGKLMKGAYDEAYRFVCFDGGNEFQAIGETAGTGIEEGVQGKRLAVTAALEELCSAAIRTGKNMITRSSWEETGRQITDGMKTGIESGIASVVGAIENMAAKATEAAQKKLDIHSPSKKFQWMGEMSGEGYITGWKESMAGIENIIAASMPGAGMDMVKGTADGDMPEAGRKYSIQQEINIYSPTDDPIEAAKRFRDSQREAAEEW